MEEFDGASPGNVIEKVKYALSVAQATAGAEGLGYALGSVELELSAVQAREVDGGLKIKIPYVEWELGAKAKIAHEKTQVISVTLRPEATAVVSFEPIDIPLTDVAHATRNGFVEKRGSDNMRTTTKTLAASPLRRLRHGSYPPLRYPPQPVPSAAPNSPIHQNSVYWPNRCCGSRSHPVRMG